MMKSANTFTSLMMSLAKVPGLFEETVFECIDFTIPQSLSCYLCSVDHRSLGEDLDVALDDALARLADR